MSGVVLWSGGASTDSVQYTYEHNGTGQLLDRTENGITNRFHWDGYNPYLENSGSNGGVSVYAYFGSDIRFDLGNSHSIDTGDSAHIFVYDEAGNVIAVTDKNGVLESNFEYDAWGNDLNDSFDNPQDNRYFCTGKYLDEVTGLYYNQARWHDPILGRFISESPIAPFSEEEYVYCFNAPTNYIDVNGEMPFCVFRWLIKLYNIKMTLQEMWDLWNLLNDPCASIGEKMWGLGKFGLDYLIPVKWLNKIPGLNQLDDFALGISKGSKIKGSYVHTFESGMEYVGKGTPSRMVQSGKDLEDKYEDILINSVFEPSVINTDKQAFIDEALKIRDRGGVKSSKLYNERNSPGAKFIK